ncbi:hypothetical protein ASG63_16650 [Methylobacterium sp. Leaf94]|uniref:hypothetical protein n=1 Tax=Methylobacterium sp. Leaf94 TaxID=1736250 RepID=UPI0006FB0E88|nr:hypothetical protein [Methylobacterium sp. Leaf94]KQU31123.1 hypothetical protein ASG63_16650 [Methylobacterium sp. Leaf94]
MYWDPPKAAILITPRFEGSFDLALEDGNGPGTPHDLAHYCWRILWAYGVHGDCEPLKVADVDLLVLRMTDLYVIQGKGRTHRTHVLQRWLDAGHLVHLGIRFGILAEEAGPDGRRQWRLLTHEPAWIHEDGPDGERVAIQVRGLPPAEQAARLELEAERAVAEEIAAAARSARPRDRIAREYRRLDAVAGPLLTRIVEHHPQARVGHAMMRIAGTMLPGAFRGEPLSAVLPTLSSLHRDKGFDVGQCIEWSGHLHRVADRAADLGLREHADPAAVPESDADALGSLAW